MGRFLRAPQQQVVSMYQPMNLDFYSGILNKAQQDLERSTAIKASAIEKLYDIPFTSKEDSDAVVGRAQELLKGATDGDFVSPSKVTNAVLAANAEVMPGVQAAKSKAKAAEMYDNMKIRYGANAWMGTDPRKQSIVDPATGKYVDAGKFKAEGLDASEVDKAFLASQLSNLTRSYEQRVASDLPGYHKLQKVTGLTDAERDKYYTPGSPTAIEEAKRQLTTMPQLKEIFGSEEEALNRIMERNYQTSGNYKQSVDNQYITDRNYIDAETSARLKASSNNSFTMPPITQPIEGDVKQNDFIDGALNHLLRNSDIKMKPGDILFDKNGKISNQSAGGGTAVVNPYGQVTSYTSPSTSSKISAYSKNIAQNKLITGMRKNLMEKKLNLVQDSSGKLRSRTDKEVYEFYTQAVNNTMNVFGKNFETTPGIEIASSNPFIDNDGNFKDFRNANVEVYEDGNWKSIDKDALAETMGLNLTKQKDVTTYDAALKGISSRVLDYSSGEAKQRASINTTKGNLSLRYNAPPQVQTHKRPVVELMSAFYEPTNKDIALGGDFKARVVSDIIINDSGEPMIIPQIEGFIGGTPEETEYFTQLYLIGEQNSPGAGYQAIIDFMQKQTDQNLYNSQAALKKDSFKLPVTKD